MTKNLSCIFETAKFKFNLFKYLKKFKRLTNYLNFFFNRVLLERLIVNRPHPWGLLVTFIELIKNPQFKFWTHQFVHCAPEIEK